MGRNSEPCSFGTPMKPVAMEWENSRAWRTRFASSNPGTQYIRAKREAFLEGRAWKDWHKLRSRPCLREETLSVTSMSYPNHRNQYCVPQFGALRCRLARRPCPTPVGKCGCWFSPDPQTLVILPLVPRPVGGQFLGSKGRRRGR